MEIHEIAQSVVLWLGIVSMLAWLMLFTALATVFLIAYFTQRTFLALSVDHLRGIGLGIIAYAMDKQQREDFLRGYEEWMKMVHKYYNGQNE